jgi:hypothetical protein
LSTTLATTPFPIKINRKVPTNSAQKALMSVVCYVPRQYRQFSIQETQSISDLTIYLR